MPDSFIFGELSTFGLIGISFVRILTISQLVDKLAGFQFHRMAFLVAGIAQNTDVLWPFTPESTVMQVVNLEPFGVLAVLTFVTSQDQNLRSELSPS
jgi:hypothetical protein